MKNKIEKKNKCKQKSSISKHIHTLGWSLISFGSMNFTIILEAAYFIRYYWIWSNYPFQIEERRNWTMKLCTALSYHIWLKKIKIKILDLLSYRERGKQELPSILYEKRNPVIVNSNETVQKSRKQNKVLLWCSCRNSAEWEVLWFQYMHPLLLINAQTGLQSVESQSQPC